MKSARMWVRHATTVLIVGFLIAVAAVGYQRSRRTGAELGSVDPQEVGIDPTDIAVGLYRGFQHTETVAGQTVFILNSIRTLSRASGWQEIEGVRLELFSKGEEGPVLTAESASFNVETREARLEGGIHVEFPNGAFLNTEAGRFQAKRQTFVSEAPVLYVDGATYGQARQASFDLKENRIVLEGNAALRAEDGALLVAPTMVYHRERREIVFSEGLELTRGASSLRAPRGLVKLSDDESGPEVITLRDGVDLHSVVDGSDAVVDMWARLLKLKRDPRGNWRISARTIGPWIEVRFSGGEDYFQRTLKTLDLRLVIGDEGVVSLEAGVAVCLHDVPMEGAIRTAQGENARAWFSQGKLTDTELSGDVEIRVGDTVATGVRVRLVQAAGLVMLQGDPTGRTRVGIDSPRGRMSCDRAVLFNRQEKVEARGKVQGELMNADLLGGSRRPEGPGPVRFAGESLDVLDGGDRFVLRENGRIWQGEQILLADEVVLLHAEEEMTAKGHVRATFPASGMDEDAGDNEDVVVDARSLDYLGATRQAVFRGSVHFADPKHSLAANRLTIHFDEENEITDVEAEGAVEIRDLVVGRRLTGTHALRSVDGGVITVIGSPAQLTDERGNTASGDSLTWNQADGTVTVDGDTELIYFPEEEP
ncbi:MAG: LptA/OstA family protein [Thermoanaerobaculales bacterium]|jgi:lipopolysaccharide export system protein LptA|nr:LptA/OstA family protein [Thermoanaerobaculales bacterium]